MSTFPIDRPNHRGSDAAIKTGSRWHAKFGELARRRRRRPRHRARRDLRLPRPERRRQVDHRAHAVHAARADRRARRRSPASTSSPSPGAVRLRIGVALQDAALDPKQTGAELLRLQGRLYGLSEARCRRSGSHELGELIDLGDALDRPHRHLLGRHEAPPRPRRRAGAQPRGPVPRRADHRARPGQPGDACGKRCAGSTTSSGMTIFLTTQYLEEADELADRVGIIDGGRIVAEGTPTELKRTVGTDVIVARVDGDAGGRATARRAASPGVHRRRGPRRRARSASTDNGSATISPVAVALAALRGRGPRPHAAHADARRRVPRAHRHPHRDRRPTTADDRAEPQEVDVMTVTSHDHSSPLARSDPRPRPAGFVARRHAPIAGRALRAVPRDLEAVIPPIFIALFFFLVNIGTLPNAHREQHPGLRLHRVPDADRDPARRHRRVARAGARARRAERLLRPAAAHAGAAHRRSCSATWSPTSPSPSALTVPILDRRLHPRRALRDRAARRPACSSLHRRAVEPRLRRLRLRDRAEDRQPGRGATRASCCSSRSCSSRSSYVPREQLSGWLDTVADVQPGDLPPRGPALARLRAAGTWDDLGAALLAIVDRRRDQHVAVLRRPPRPHPPRRLSALSSAPRATGRPANSRSTRSSLGQPEDHPCNSASTTPSAAGAGRRPCDGSPLDAATAEPATRRGGLQAARH